MKIELLILLGARRPGAGVLAIDYAPPLRTARTAPRSVKRVLNPAVADGIAALLGGKRDERP